MTEEVKHSFNIFECGRNILDRIDVMYQRTFIATPAENDYHKEMLKILIKVNNGGRKLCYEKLRQAVIDLRAKTNVEHECNINNITCDDLYQSPIKNKYVSTINNYVYYESDEHVNAISDSSKQVDASNEPIK